MKSAERRLRSVDCPFAHVCMIVAILVFYFGPRYLWSLPALLLVAMFIALAEWENTNRTPPIYLTFKAYFVLGVSYMIALIGSVLFIIGLASMVSDRLRDLHLLQWLFPRYVGLNEYLLSVMAVIAGAVFVWLMAWAVRIVRYMYPLDFGEMPTQTSNDAILTRDYRKVRQGIDRDPR